MTRRGVTWLLAILLAIPLVAIGLFGLLAGTEAGTRWLARMAEPYLPEPLEITTPSGTLLGGVRIATLRWQDERRSVEARSVELNLELVPLIDREIRLTALEASSLDVRIMPEESPAPFDGSLPQIELPLRLHLESVRIDNVALDLPGFQREIDRIEASLDANRDRIRIDELRVASSWLDLNLRGRLWTTGRYRADLSADWRYVLSDDRILAGRLSIDGDADALAVDHRLNEPYAVSSSGVIDTLITAPAFDLVHRWESITLSAGERTVTSTDGRLATRGAADDLAVELSTSIAVEGLPEAATELVGRTDWRSLDIESLLLDSDAGKAALAGAISWADGIRFDTAFEFSDVDAAQLTDRVHGRIGIDGSADGRYVDNALRLDATIDALSGELNDWPLSGSAGVSYDDGSIELADAALALGDNRLTLNGSIAERLDLTAGLALASASVIDPRASGSLQVDAMIRGEAQNPAVNARIRGDGLSFSGIRAERLEGTVAVTEQRSVDAALDLARVGTEEFVVETGAIRVDGNFESHDIDIQLTDDAERLRVTATGSLAEEAWRARIDALDIDTRVLDAWSLEQPAALEFAADSVSLGTLCLASASTGGRLCAEGRYRAQASYALLEMRRLPLAALPIRLPAGAGIEGFVESDVDLRLEGEELRGDGVMRLVDAVMVATYEDEPYELRVSEAFVNANIENSRLISSLSVVFNDGGGEASASLEIDDVLRTDSSIRGSGRLGIPDASIAGVFLPDLSGPTGRIDGDLAVTGSLAAPDFSGEIRLEDASFGVRPAGIRITDLNLRLSQLDAGRLQVDGSARSGEGEVSIRGATRVNAEEGLRAEVSLTGSGFELVRLPDWRVEASPDINLVLDDRTATVTGQLDVPKADITVNSVPETAVRPSGDVTVHGERTADETTQRSIRVNVVVGLGDAVQLNAFGLSTGVEGRVRIRGGSREPYTGNGSLSLKDGRYKAYGQDLEIESGELVFNGRLDNPQLDVRAVRRIEAEDVVAGIRLSGTPRQLRSEVYSDPSMRDAEVLSYLLTGRSISSRDAEDDDLLNSAAFALGLSQAGSITSQIRGDLGLDTLSVEGGSESGRIVAGKRFGDRLLVEYGYGIIDQLGTLLLRYQLNNRLVLESRTGTVSELDLVYSVKKK